MALALAAIVLGIVLNTVSRQTLGVARAMPRYQAVLQASQALELKMEQDASGEKATAQPTFKFDQKVAVVTADPRVEQVEIKTFYAGGNSLTLAAYRLRVKRRRGGDSASPTPSPTPTP